MLLFIILHSIVPTPMTMRKSLLTLAAFLAAASAFAGNNPGVQSTVNNLKAGVNMQERQRMIEKEISNLKAGAAVKEVKPAEQVKADRRGTVKGSLNASSTTDTRPYLDQFKQRFFAYGDKVQWAGGDIWSGFNEADAKKTGYMEITFDEEGKVVHRGQLAPNKTDDNGTWLFVKEESNVSPDGTEVYTRYRQDYKGEWYLDDQETTRYQGDILVESEVRYVQFDENGYSTYVSSKTEGTFDDQGRVISTISYYGESHSDELTPNKKVEYEYTDDGLIYRTSYYYNSYSSSWVLQNRYMDYTDEDGIRYYELYTYDSRNKSWKGNIKTTTQKDEEDLTVWKIEYEWDNYANSWLLYRKTEYERDDKGRITRYFTSKWDGQLSEWYVSSKSGFMYEGETETGDWNIDYDPDGTASGKMYRYKYDEFDRLISFTVNTYVIRDGAYMWDLLSSEEYVYVNDTDPDDMRLDELKETYWSESTGEMTECTKTGWLYDDYGNITRINTYEWDKAASEWWLREQNQFLYEAGVEYGTWTIDYERDGKASGTMYKFKNDALGRQVSYTVYSYIFRDGHYYWNFESEKECVYFNDTDPDDMRYTELVETQWDLYTDDIISRSKEVWGYDDHGNVTKYEKYSWENGAWAGEQKQSRYFVYIAGVQIPIGTEQYEWKDGEWQTIGKLVVNMGAGGIPSSVETCKLIGGEWTVTSRIDITVDLAAMTGVTVMRMLDVSTGELANFSRSEFTVHLPSIVEYLTYKWNSSDESWTLLTKDVKSVSSEMIEGREYSTIAEEEYQYDKETDSWTGCYNNATKYYKGEAVGWIEYEWDPNWETWVGVSNYEYLADDEGNTLHTASYNWDYGYMAWTGKEMYDYAYDKDGNMTMEASYDWDRYDGWTADYKEVYAYDALGNTILEEYYFGMEDGVWIGDSRYEMAYDRNGNEILDAVYFWNDERMVFEGLYRNEYSYDNNGEEIGMTKYEWDCDNWCWMGVYKYSNSVNGNITVYEEYDWDAETGTWVGDEKYIKTVLDVELHDKTETVSYKWDDGAWVTNYKETEEYMFRTDGNIETELKTRVRYNAETGKWYDGAYVRADHRYTPRTKVEELMQPVQVFASDGCISVEASDGASVTVSSIAGTRVATASGSVKLTVPAGIYIVTVDGQASKVLVR